MILQCPRVGIRIHQISCHPAEGQGHRQIYTYRGFAGAPFWRCDHDLAGIHLALEPGRNITTKHDLAVVIIFGDTTRVRAPYFSQHLVKFNAGHGVGEGWHAASGCPGRQPIRRPGYNEDHLPVLGRLDQRGGLDGRFWRHNDDQFEVKQFQVVDREHRQLGLDGMFLLAQGQV